MFLAPFIMFFLLLNFFDIDGILFSTYQQYTGILGFLILCIAFMLSMNSSFKYNTRQVTQLLTKADLFLWLGSILIFFHASQHKPSMVPWFGVFMLLIFLSHLTIGKYLFVKNIRLYPKKNELRMITPTSIANHINSFPSNQLTLLEKWKLIHIIIFYILAIVILAHLFSLFLLWV